MTDPLSEYRKDGNGRVDPAEAAYKRYVFQTYGPQTWNWRNDALPRGHKEAFMAGWNARRNYEDANPRPTEKWCVNGQPFG